MALEGSAYVYVVYCAETGLCKIGTTRTPEKRLRDLQRVSAYPMKMVAVFDCHPSAGMVFERMFHDILKDCRTHGEWFKLSESHIASMSKNLFPLMLTLELYLSKGEETLYNILGYPGCFIPSTSIRAGYLLSKHWKKMSHKDHDRAGAELVGLSWFKSASGWWASPKGYMFEDISFAYSALKEFGAENL